MKKIVLFDQDLQHYRKNIYRAFAKEFVKKGYIITVYFDQALGGQVQDSLFNAIRYDFASFRKAIYREHPDIIIQFVWLRYKFVLPFMAWAKMKGCRIIVWSHGINLQNQNQKLKNMLYYVRQLLADALIIYTPEQKRFIKASKKKLFIANNTLAFCSFPIIADDKARLKMRHKLGEKKVILSVARFDTNNRKVAHLVELSKMLDNNYHVLLIGPGISDDRAEEIADLPNIEYKGPLFEERQVCEYYKLADVFVMPGAIGLAINQAQYFGTPVIAEDVEHGPEAYYLKHGYNGFLYDKDDVEDLRRKVLDVLDDEKYPGFSKNAKATSRDLGSFDRMLNGFLEAIRYVTD